MPRSSHKYAGHPLYTTWSAFKQRCTNPRNKSYPDYGGRGITFAPEWGRFGGFFAWAIAHPAYCPGLTIERVDVNGNYEPGNCTWIPRALQSRNRRTCQPFTYKGDTRVLTEWARDPRCRISQQQLSARLQRGWDFVRAFETPPIFAGAAVLKARGGRPNLPSGFRTP